MSRNDLKTAFQAVSSLSIGSPVKLPTSSQNNADRLPTDHRAEANSPVRFGVLGTGRITRRMVADLQSTPGATVTAIASRSADRARWQADSYGIAAAVEGYENLLRRDDVDAVYVALPPWLHHQWTLAAIEQNKPVLCEKPIAVDAAEATGMFEAADRENVRLLDATAWLHHDRTDQFRSWLATTDPSHVIPIDPQTNQPSIPFRVGPMRHVSASVSFRSPFQNDDHRLQTRIGGGCLMDLGWYSAGLIRFATGRLPDRVHADAVLRDGVITRVSATMRFGEGDSDDITATLSCGFDTATRKWCEIAGEDASIVCDDFTRPWPDKPARTWIHEASGKVHAMVPPSDQEPRENGPSEKEPSEKEPGSTVNRCHQERRMIAALVDWIRRPVSDETTAPPWRAFQEQAIQTQQILDKIAESIESGQPVS